MRVLHDPDIGKVYLDKTGRSKKNYNIYVLPDGVKISIPPGGSYKNAQKLVIKLKSKIIKNKNKLKNKLNKNTVFSEDTSFCTRNYQLKIIRDKEDFTVKLNEKELIVNIPANVQIESNLAQDFIRTAIEETWRIEAKQYIPNRLKYLAELHGFEYNSVKITKAKKRWGSCSTHKKLNFSLFLMRLPDELIDHVILHELCHLKQPNHGEFFYELLNKISAGQDKKHEKELKNYSPAVY